MANKSLKCILSSRRISKPSRSEVSMWVWVSHHLQQEWTCSYSSSCIWRVEYSREVACSMETVWCTLWYQAESSWSKSGSQISSDFHLLWGRPAFHTACRTWRGWSWKSSGWGLWRRRGPRGVRECPTSPTQNTAILDHIWWWPFLKALDSKWILSLGKWKWAKHNL